MSIDLKPIRIGILGVPDSPYVNSLQRAAQGLADVQIQLLKFVDLQASIGAYVQHKPVNSHRVENCPLESSQSPGIDALIVRSMPLGTLEQVIFRMDCLQAWESRGVVVVNPARSLEVAIDKWLTLHRLHQQGVDVPATVACQTREAAMQAMQLLGGDVLVKPLFGGEGRGIVRLQDMDTAWRVMGSLQQIGQVLYVQQFMEHFGYDIRVLFVGDRVYSIKRHAAPNSWRTNLAQGSTAEPHVLTPEELTVARQAAQAVGGSLLGVDLLPCRDGRLVTLEVNAVPGWRGLGQALGVDVATEVLAYVRQASLARRGLGC